MHFSVAFIDIISVDPDQCVVFQKVDVFIPVFSLRIRVPEIMISVA